MSFVTLVEEERADLELKRKYDGIRKELGFLPNYYLAIGRKPATVDAQFVMNNAMMDEGALPRALKEQIGLVVSGLNTSSYCVALHMEFLRQYGMEKAFGRKLAVDYPNAPVSEKEKALFRFADKLTKHPEDIDKADAEELRKHGWDEAALLDTVLVVAYFNFVNRVSIGLGLVADF